MRTPPFFDTRTLPRTMSAIARSAVPCSIRRSPGAAVIQAPRLTSCSTLRDGSWANASRRTSSSSCVSLTGRRSRWRRQDWKELIPAKKTLQARCPLRCGLKDEIADRNQRRGHREQPQPQNVADAVSGVSAHARSKTQQQSTQQRKSCRVLNRVTRL